MKPGITSIPTMDPTQHPSSALVSATSSSSPQDVAILGFDNVPGTQKLKAKASEPGIPGPRSALVCTRIPSSVIDQLGTTECALDPRTKRLLSTVLSHPRSIPDHPNDAYVIRPTGTSGLGMFALRKIDVGDLIVVERPLVIMPSMSIPQELTVYLHSLNPETEEIPTQSMARAQAILEVLFQRMCNDDQEAFSNLLNIHNNDGFELLGHMRTNAVGVGNLGLGDELGRYDAVCRDVSRVNHSCRPNCALSFHTSSFSVELRASKTIDKDEEILLSYCSLTVPTRERQSQLSDWNIVCTCFSCKPTPSNPSNDVMRTSISARLRYLEDNIPEVLRADDPADTMRAIIANPVASDAAVKRFRNYVHVLLCDMVAEGLNGSTLFLKAMELYALATIGHAMSTMTTIPRSDHYREYAEMRMCFEGQAAGMALQMMNRAVLAHYGSSHDQVEFVKWIRKKFGFMAGCEC